MKRREGFTLFELLIAIFIGTTLIMAGAYAIRVGLFSMEREETWFNDSIKEKAAFDFFWQQVSSLRIQRISHKDNLLTKENKKTKKKKTIYFSGEKDSLTFVSPLSLKNNYSQGLIIATYDVKSNNTGSYDMMYRETMVNPVILTKLSEEPESLNAREDAAIFLKDCNSIAFAYLDDTEEDVGGEDATDTEEDPYIKVQDTNTIQDINTIEGTNLRWKEKISAKVPLAIKLLVSKNGKEQELIAPIMVMYSSLASGQ